MGARPVRGSSRSISVGEPISALAIDSSCCSPPLSVPAIRALQLDIMGSNEKISSRRRFSYERPRATNPPNRRLSITVMLGITLRPSGTWPMPRRAT